MDYLLSLNPALIAMQVAVSILSPVSIQIYIPAALRDSIVSPTSSYNLSSTPVMPNSSISVSNSSMHSVIRASLSPRLALASVYF